MNPPSPPWVPSAREPPYQAARGGSVTPDQRPSTEVAMGHAVGDVLGLAAAVAVSALPIIVLIRILATPYGRRNGLLFLPVPEGWPPRSTGTGARLSAHDIASTLTSDPAAHGRRAKPRDRAWAQFWAHSPPSRAVHLRPHDAHLHRPRTVAASGEQRPALLESVLGASPREFESRILRDPDQARHRSAQTHPPAGHAA
jgi:hypothetical protein